MNWHAVYKRASFSANALRRRLHAHSSQTEFLLLVDQLAQLLHAGIPLPEALVFLQEQLKKPWSRTTVLQGINMVNQGRPLSDGWRECAPRLCLTLIRAGEESGTLAHSLRTWHGIATETRHWRSRLTRAFTYPCLLISTSICLLIFMFKYVLPMFHSMYVGLGVRGAEASQTLERVGTLIFWILVVGLGFLTTSLVVIYKARYRIPTLWGCIKDYVPGRNLVITWRTSVYMNMVHMLVDAGVPLVRAIRIVGTDMSSQWMSIVSADIEPKILAGQPLRDLFLKNDWHEYTPLFMGVAERTGDISQSLSRIAELTKTDLIRRLDRALGLLEPIVMICVGAIVMVTMLSIFLPMYEFMTTMTAGHGM